MISISKTYRPQPVDQISLPPAPWDKAPKQPPADDMRARVLAGVTATPCQASTIAKRIGVTTKTAARMLEQLHREGRIQGHLRGAWRYWRGVAG